MDGSSPFDGDWTLYPLGEFVHLSRRRSGVLIIFFRIAHGHLPGSKGSGRLSCASSRGRGGFPVGGPLFFVLSVFSLALGAINPSGIVFSIVRGLLSGLFFLSSLFRWRKSLFIS